MSVTQMSVKTLMATATLSIAGTLAQAGLVNNLENPPYTVGNINGQDGGQWSVTTFAPGSHSANIVTSPAAYEGTQSLQITDAGAGYFEPLRYNLSPTNVTAAGVTNGGNFSLVIKALSGTTSGIGISPLRAEPDGNFDIRRPTIFFQGNGDIVHYNPVSGDSTTLGAYTSNVWYLVELESFTDGGGNLTSNLSVTNLGTNSVVGTLTGVASGNEAGRTHWGGIDFTTDSTPTGQWQIDSIRFNSEPVPEPSIGLIAAAGSLLGLRRRSK